MKRFGKDKLKDAFFHLNDNPQKRCVWSGATGALPTLRRAMGPIHSQSEDRPITGRESLTAMGFIAYDDLASETGLEVLLPTWLLDDPGVFQITGNAMHLANATIVTTIALACVTRINPEELAFARHVGSEPAPPPSTSENQEPTADDLATLFQKHVQ